MNIIKEGAILVSKWGYEQTNVDFYQVIKATSKTVIIRELQKQQSYNGATMTGLTVPLRDQFVEKSKEMRRKIDTDWKGVEPVIYVSKYESCQIWDGELQKYTSYA